eukprot:7474265-Alexandrium_andersonii.AAC.1
MGLLRPPAGSSGPMSPTSSTTGRGGWATVHRPSPDSGGRWSTAMGAPTVDSTEHPTQEQEPTGWARLAGRAARMMAGQACPCLLAAPCPWTYPSTSR